MKKYWILIAGLLLLAGCTTQKKEQLKYGEIIPTEDGMILPMANAPGEKQDNWCIGVTFGDQALYMQSPRELRSCYVSIAYMDPSTGQQDVSDIDLDFIDRAKNGTYVYSLSYLWFVSRATMENALQVTFYYAPSNVALPSKEIEVEDGGKLTFPDFTGYCFVFNQEECAKYLKALTEKLR